MYVTTIKKLLFIISNYRSEEKDFENFMRAFFGQFPSEREKFQGSSKPQKRRRKRKH